MGKARVGQEFEDKKNELVSTSRQVRASERVDIENKFKSEVLQKNAEQEKESTRLVEIEMMSSEELYKRGQNLR